MVEFYLPTSAPNPRTTVILQRYARKMVIKRTLHKYWAWGNVSFRRHIPELELAIVRERTS